MSSGAPAALDVAARLAADVEAEASARDSDRILPHDQVKALKASGLLALPVPAEYGGREWLLQVRTSFDDLLYVRSSRAVVPGDHVMLSAPAERVLVYAGES